MERDLIIQEMIKKAIIKLYKSGQNPIEIEREIGIKSSSVRNYLRNLSKEEKKSLRQQNKIINLRETVERINRNIEKEIIELYQSGKGKEEIETQIGFTKIKIRQSLQEIEQEQKKHLKKQSNEEEIEKERKIKEKIKLLYKNGKKPIEIGKILNIRLPEIRRYLRILEQENDVADNIGEKKMERVNEKKENPFLEQLKEQTILKNKISERLENKKINDYEK